MSGTHICDPIAHRFVNRFLEGSLARRDRHNLRAEQFHASDIKRLTFHIDAAHINDALAAKARSHCGCGHAVLAGAGFSDNALLAHPSRQKNLA